MHDITLKRIFILSAIAMGLWILYLLKPIVIPFVAAFFIAYLLSYPVNKLAKFLPRWLAITNVFLAIILVMIWAVWFVVPLVWKQLVYFRDSLPAGIQWINHTLLPWASKTFNVERMKIDTDQLSEVVMNYIQTNYSIDSIQSMLLSILQSGLNFIQVSGTVVLMPVIAFYFLLDWNRMLGRMHRLIPPRYEVQTLNIVHECHEVLGAFVKGQFLVMILLGIVYAAGLQLVGIEVGLIIGMVAGLASIIPYLGFAVGIIAAVIATLFQFGLDWAHLLMVFGVFMIGQMVEGYILQPFLLGDKIGLSPVAVVFAVLAGAQLGGFLGMLVALPVAAVIVVLLKHLRQYYEQTEFYQPRLVINAHHLHTEQQHQANEQLDLDVDVENPPSSPSSDHNQVK